MPIDYHTKGPVEQGLCGTCSEAGIVTFENQVTEVWCREFAFTVGQTPRRITRRVVRCTEYRERGRKNKEQLERIAWILEFKKGGPAGFGTPPEAIFRPPEKPKRSGLDE